MRKVEGLFPGTLAGSRESPEQVRAEKGKECQVTLAHDRTRCHPFSGRGDRVKVALPRLLEV